VIQPTDRARRPPARSAPQARRPARPGSPPRRSHHPHHHHHHHHHRRSPRPHLPPRTHPSSM